MIELSIQQIMTLIALASKACEHEEKFISALFPDKMNMEQIRSAIIEGKKVLSNLDEKYPGMLPLPHDGISWSKRGGEMGLLQSWLASIRLGKRLTRKSWRSVD